MNTEFWLGFSITAAKLPTVDRIAQSVLLIFLTPLAALWASFRHLNDYEPSYFFKLYAWWFWALLMEPLSVLVPRFQGAGWYRYRFESGVYGPLVFHWSAPSSLRWRSQLYFDSYYGY